MPHVMRLTCIRSRTSAVLYGVIRGTTTGALNAVHDGVVPSCFRIFRIGHAVWPGVFQSLLSAGLAFTALGVRQPLTFPHRSFVWDIFAECTCVARAGGDWPCSWVQPVVYVAASIQESCTQVSQRGLHLQHPQRSGLSSLMGHRLTSIASHCTQGWSALESVLSGMVGS